MVIAFVAEDRGLIRTKSYDFIRTDEAGQTSGGVTLVPELLAQMLSNPL